VEKLDDSLCYEFCYALQTVQRQEGRGKLLIGWQLTPVVSLQPTKVLESDRDGVGRKLFVLACGLVASYSQQLCSK
jgi:hypothetical protein